jgi:transcriptional regulator with XRE-family HTH domain
MDDITGRDLIRMQLKRERESAGLTLRELAAELNWSKSILGAVETGDRLPKPDLAAALDARFNPTLKFVELLANVRDSLIAEHMRELLPQERKAVRIQTFTSSVINGLLQTRGYAYAMSRDGMPGATDEAIADRVTLRMDRQEDVFQREDPPFYRAIIDEAVLARPVGDKLVMAEQLRHLVQLSRKPRSEVLILPFCAGGHGLMGGSLALWHLADGRAVALAESFGPGEPIENPARVTFYSEMYDAVKIAALPPEESLKLIDRYVKEYDND